MTTIKHLLILNILSRIEFFPVILAVFSALHFLLFLLFRLPLIFMSLLINKNIRQQLFIGT